MCLVEVEKMPKLMAACTLPVGRRHGGAHRDADRWRQARKSTLEFLLTNHPLDCPVCDKGGECELQDMVFRYGAGESRFTETKMHVDEKQWSPVVFYDAPALHPLLPLRAHLQRRHGRAARWGSSTAASSPRSRPTIGDHLECDECGMCIDICPVGALTSGTYRYKTRPWEMEHVGTICTHCADGCKTTLGVRNDKIIRGNNRDRSGINGEFLCIKGRYAFDFYDHPERLQSPLMRVNGKLEPVSWSKALAAVAAKFSEVQGARRQVRRHRLEPHHQRREFLPAEVRARRCWEPSNIDHHRTGDVVTLLDALSGTAGALATTADLYNAKAVLVIGADLALEHPFLSFQIRANFRHHQAHVYVVTPEPVREDQVRRGQRARRAGRGTCRRRIAARQAEGRTGTGDPLRRRHQGRGRPQAGRVRRIARHPGEIRLPGRLFEFARRGGYGAAARAPGIGHGAARHDRRQMLAAGSGRALGGGRESARRTRAGGRQARSSWCRIVPDRDRAGAPTWCFPPPPPTKRTARSPTSAAKCSGSSRP